MQKLHLVHHSPSEVTGVTLSSVRLTRHFELRAVNSKLCACMRAIWYLCLLEHVNGSTAAVVINGELKVWRLLTYDHMFTLIHLGTLKGSWMVQRFYKTLYLLAHAALMFRWLDHGYEGARLEEW